MAKIIKTCVTCGIAITEDMKYMNNQCIQCIRDKQREYRHNNQDKIIAYRRKKKEKKTKTSHNLDEIALRARAEGLSYGQYVARQFKKREEDGKSD